MWDHGWAQRPVRSPRGQNKALWGCIGLPREQGRQIHLCHFGDSFWRLKGHNNGCRHEPVGLVRRAEYVTSKTATSALGAGSLEWLNSAAQSGYASGSLVAAANRGCASTARSGGSYAASGLIKINAPIYLIQHMRRGCNIAKASDRQELGLK